MVEGLVWVICIGAVVAALLIRCLPARRRSAANGPSAPPRDENAQAQRGDLSDAARAELDALDRLLDDDDTAGSVADASNSAHEDR